MGFLVCAGWETEGIIPVRLTKGRLKTRLSGFQTTFYTERKLKIYGSRRRRMVLLFCSKIKSLPSKR